MDTQTPTPKPPGSTRLLLLSWLEYLKKALMFAAGIATLIALSFLVIGSFSAKTYSDRLFMGGVIVTFIGVFVFITVGGTRRNLGFGSIAKKPEEAKKLMEHTHELLAKAERRYDAGSLVWVTGVVCLVLSVLLYLILSAFGI